MRWPWSRTTHRTDGQRARQEAECSLDEARARWPEVLRVSRSLRELRERNHFADTIAASFRGERP